MDCKQTKTETHNTKTTTTQTQDKITEETKQNFHQARTWIHTDWGIQAWWRRQRQTHTYLKASLMAWRESNHQKQLS